MSAAPQEATESTDEPPSDPAVATRKSGWVRRHRGLAILSGVVAVGLALGIWNQLAPKGDSETLSLANAGPNGSRAVGEILGRHGVEVHQAGDFETAMEALANSDYPTLLLYDRSGFLSGEQLSELADSAVRIVVVTPRLATLSALTGSGAPEDATTPNIRQAGVVPDGVPVLEPGCSLPDAVAAGPVSGDAGFTYDGGTTCYRPQGAAGGMLAVSDDERLTVLGSTTILGNRHLAEHGNAALALRTLGTSEDLVWYLPSLADLEPSGAPTSLAELRPKWVPYLGPWLLIVALAAIVWRGRRNGPLVFEPLPVVVKAVETAEGRARLYHDARALGQARDNLRAGTLVRLSGKLRLGPEATDAQAIEALARLLGRPADRIRTLINEHPGTEARLVAWAQELDQLEKEVRNT